MMTSACYGKQMESVRCNGNTKRSVTCVQNKQIEHYVVGEFCVKLYESISTI